MHARTRTQLLAMFRVLEQTKDAVEKYERGEINLPEAIRLIKAATARVHAA
jgi:hypothetical protein